MPKEQVSTTNTSDCEVEILKSTYTKEHVNKLFTIKSYTQKKLFDTKVPRDVNLNNIIIEMLSSPKYIQYADTYTRGKNSL